MPLLDERAKFVTGNADTSEVGIAIKALDFLNLQFDYPPGELVLVLLVQVSVCDLENTASQGVSRDVLA